MNDSSERINGVSRREFIRKSAAGVAGGLFIGCTDVSGTPLPQGETKAQSQVLDPVSHIYHSRNGTPTQNVAKVFDMAYEGLENFIGPDDIVLLRPNLQWANNGYTNSEIGLAMIDLILRRPGGFTGEVIVVENTHRSDPHENYNSGWCTTATASNGPYNWFEVVQYFLDHADEYPEGIHTDPHTGQINVSFQFLMRRFDFTLENPHPILTRYGGMHYSGVTEQLDGSVDPFLRFKYDYPDKTCFYVARSDIRYTNDIARVSSLYTQYEMNYPVFKSQHSGLYVSLYKDHTTAWDPDTESFVPRPVKLINMATLNHHGAYAGVTSVVKAHFGMVDRNFHATGWDNTTPPTFFYAGGAIGYWLDMIRRPDLHMSCAERIGRISRSEDDAFRAKSVAISTDPVALDFYVGKHILFPAGGVYGLGGAEATEPWSNDPTLEGGYYGLTLEFCHDPLADHSIINGTLNEEEMVVRLYDFEDVPGDLDDDGDVDLADYERFYECQNGPGSPPGDVGCDKADPDSDGDVDLADFGRFIGEFGG